MPANLTDEQLVVEIREKDKELYGEIIKRYQQKLTHYLYKFVYSSEEIEDVLQDVFIKAYQNLFAFNIGKKFSPWIYRIAHNEGVNYLKKHSKRVISLEENELEVVDEKMDIHSKIEQKQLKAKIEECLMELKEKYREPLILFYFEEKSYEEISDILRIPKSTVGTLISRGKTMLKKNLEEKLYGRKQ